MHETPALVLFELGGAEGLRFSPYCWRSRYALAHKSLAAERQPVHCTDKAQIAPSGHGRVPVLRDGEVWVGDSWRIACHLEERSPQPPLFPAGRALARLVDEESGQRAASADPARDRARDRQTRRSGRPRLLSGIARTPSRGHDRIVCRAARRVHARPGTEARTLRGALAEAPHLAGDAPAYVDYVLAGTFEWIARTSTLSVPAAGSRPGAETYARAIARRGSATPPRSRESA